MNDIKEFKCPHCGVLVRIPKPINRADEFEVERLSKHNRDLAAALEAARQIAETLDAQAKEWLGGDNHMQRAISWHEVQDYREQLRKSVAAIAERIGK